MIAFRQSFGWRHSRHPLPGCRAAGHVLRRCGWVEALIASRHRVRMLAITSCWPARLKLAIRLAVFAIIVLEGEPRGGLYGISRGTGPSYKLDLVR